MVRKGDNVVQRRLVTALSATALSLSLIAGTPVFAQTLGLDASAMSGLAKIGIDTSGITSMTTEQVAQIENILASNETDQQKKMHVQELLKGEATDTGRLGVNQLRSSVSSDLAGLGLDASGVDSLTLSQLGQIENVTASSDSDATKKMRISEIIGNEATETGRLGVPSSPIRRRPTSRASASTARTSTPSRSPSSRRSKTSWARPTPTTSSASGSTRSCRNKAAAQAAATASLPGTDQLRSREIAFRGKRCSIAGLSVDIRPRRPS